MMRLALLFSVSAVCVLAGIVPLGVTVFHENDDSAALHQTHERSVGEPGRLSSDHPLAPVLTFASECQAHVQDEVYDFSCHLTKCERIDGQLQQPREIDMRIREEHCGPDGKVCPPCAYLDFHSPAEVAGRRLVYSEGKHGSKMLARKGGNRFNFIVVHVDPHGWKAQAESLVPITQVSFKRSLASLTKAIEAQMEADPSGANTEVQWSEDAELDGRPCVAIRVMHPRPDESLGFHWAQVHVDKEHHVPLRIEVRDWPQEPGGKPPLIAEYTYSDLQVNVGLGDQWFDGSLVYGR